MKDKRSVERLRTALASADRSGVGRGYPGELRRAAAAHLAVRLSAGASIGVVAAELGLRPMTLRRWSLTHGTSNAFRAVQVVDEIRGPDGATLVAHGPCGLRIEGGVGAIASLVRSLA
jgi:hypothetical protein